MVPYDNAWICAGCKPAFFQRLQQGDGLGLRQNYAGFGIRLAAKLIDGLAVMVAIAPIYAWYFFSVFQQLKANPGKPPVTFTASTVIFEILVLGISVGYSVVFLGRFGATPGKMACKLRVVTPEGRPISYGRAFGRFLSEMVSGMTCYIGYIMVGFDEERRALHDRMASTRVIRID